MVFDQTHTFMAGLLLAGAVGARRGWHKEVISSAIILSNVLFLSNGGGAFLAHLFTNTLGTGASAMGSALFAGGGGGGSATGGVTAPVYANSTASCYLGLQAAMSKLAFLTITPIGYWAGSRHGPRPKIASHRVAGTVPGMVNGAAIAYYLSNYMFPGTPIQLNAPSSAATSSFLPIVFGVGLLALLIVLFIAGQMKKAASGGGGN